MFLLTHPQTIFWDLNVRNLSVRCDLTRRYDLLLKFHPWSETHMFKLKLVVQTWHIVRSPERCAWGDSTWCCHCELLRRGGCRWSCDRKRFGWFRCRLMLIPSATRRITESQTKTSVSLACTDFCQPLLKLLADIVILVKDNQLCFKCCAA